MPTRMLCIFWHFLKGISEKATNLDICVLTYRALLRISGTCHFSACLKAAIEVYKTRNVSCQKDDHSIRTTEVTLVSKQVIFQECVLEQKWVLIEQPSLLPDDKLKTSCMDDCTFLSGLTEINRSVVFADITDGLGMTQNPSFFYQWGRFCVSVNEQSITF